MKKASPQEYWDMLIVDGWINDQIFYMIIADFRRYTDGPVLDSALLAGIKRPLICNYVGDPRRPVRVLVAARLPKLSGYLWHVYPEFTDDTYHAALKILRASKQVAAAPRRRFKSELKELVKEGKSTRRVDANAGHRRSDWHIVKPTNN